MLRQITISEWTPATAAHLLNRAGFGAPPAEIGRLARRPPAEVVDALVEEAAAGDEVIPPSWVTPEAAQRPPRRELRRLSEEERQMRQREARIREGERIVELRHWWLSRMRTTGRPLQEKMALFWHGHFATSMEKVRSAYAMYLQNTTFRAHATQAWADLVTAVAQDPAMLIYLDNATSRARQPNENFARELMELFTLGEGQYAEDDIKAAARAFTGWSLAEDRFAFQDRPRAHDGGSKTLFGKTGAFDGADAIRIILDQPPAYPFICRKLWSFFAYAEPEEVVVAELAGQLRQARGRWAPVLKNMLLSRAFYGPRAVRTQIKSPVQWLVSTARMLDAPLPAAEVCNGMLSVLGQDLFAPPNVKGWSGGYAWITTDTLMKRYNLAGFLVKGGTEMAAGRAAQTMMGDEPGPLRRLATRHLATMPPLIDPARVVPAEARSDTTKLIHTLEWMLFQAPLRPADRAAVTAYIARRPTGRTWDDEAVRDLLHVMMCTPQFQLC